MMNKKAEYGGNAMFQNNKKAAFLDYLMNQLWVQPLWQLP